GLGGPARRLVEVGDEAETVAAVRAADGPVLVLAGGSNVVIGDTGFDGTVVLLRGEGVALRRDGDTVLATVAGGHTWDDVVVAALDAGLAGVECLSGIPGSAGATPIQNVGAYGQEIAETVTEVRAYDRIADKVVVMPPAECGFGYRTSVFKHNDR